MSELTPIEMLEKYESAPRISMNFDSENGGEGAITLTLTTEGELFEREDWDPDGFMLALGALLRENF